MRYLDWDVLLFPKNNEATDKKHVPFQEFKTTCSAVQERRPYGVSLAWGQSLSAFHRS